MAFDIIGSIAIIKLPVNRDIKQYAHEILDKHKNVKTVLLQKTKVLPPFRIPEYELVLGDPNTETIHSEYGLRFKLDPTKTYYSPRLENERMRIAKQVRDGEEVLVMFSGVNPYPIYIAKFANPKIVYSIEWNPFSVKYGIESLRLNTKKVEYSYSKELEEKIKEDPNVKEYKTKNGKIIVKYYLSKWVKTILGDVKKVNPVIEFLDDRDGVIDLNPEYLNQVIESKLKFEKAIFYGKCERLLSKIKEINAKKKYIWCTGEKISKDCLSYDGIIRESSKEFFIIDLDTRETYRIKKFGKEFDRIVMPLPKEAGNFLDVAIPLIKENGIIHLYQFAPENKIKEYAMKVLDIVSSELGFKYEILDIVKVGNTAPGIYRICIDLKVVKKNC